jgi:myosin-1
MSRRLRKSDLQVTVDAKFKCMLGNKRKILQIEVVPEVTEPIFKKDGDNILYALPPTVEIIDDSANRLKIKTGS